MTHLKMSQEAKNLSTSCYYILHNLWLAISQ